jgi:hypothetical protein
MPTIDRVARYIAMLGRLDGEDEIAHLLTRRHILGRPRSANTCPLSVYLRIKTGASWVLVDTKFTWVVHRYEMRRIANPDSMRAFVIRLDHGGYPELEWEPSGAPAVWTASDRA